MYNRETGVLTSSSGREFQVSFGSPPAMSGAIGLPLTNEEIGLIENGLLFAGAIPQLQSDLDNLPEGVIQISIFSGTILNGPPVSAFTLGTSFATARIAFDPGFIASATNGNLGRLFWHEILHSDLTINLTSNQFLGEIFRDNPSLEIDLLTSLDAISLRPETIERDIGSAFRYAAEEIVIGHSPFTHLGQW